MEPRSLRLKADFYAQFDADYSRDIPAEGYGGWRSEEIELEAHRVAFVLMHAWDAGTLEENPGAWRCCDEIPRTYHVCRTVLPPLLAAIRKGGVPLFHVVGGAGYFEELPGYKRAVSLAGADDPAFPQVAKEGNYWPTKNFITDRSFPGRQNKIDLAKAPPTRFPREAVPVGDEGVAKNSQQLAALCRDAGIYHLIYMGFNIDWCLLMSPGGMVDMWRHGLICSAVRQAVTAVENKETARRELCKEIGLWRVSVQGGLVLNDVDVISALGGAAAASPPGVSAAGGATWIERGGEVYGAKPDARGPIGGGAGYADAVTGGDFVARDLKSLLAALAQAKPGQTVFIPPDVEIDLTEQSFLDPAGALVLPAGVTLAGGRGLNGAPGALLYSDAHLAKMIRVPGDGSRVTGLRLRGPDGKRRLEFHHHVFYAEPAPAIGRDQAYYLLPNSDGMVVDGHRLTVDNCEISHFSHGGVYLVRGRGHHIHHCFMHHIQRMGLGYPICHNHDSQSLIERCLFQDNKHSIAGTGSPGQCYEAAHNVVLPFTESHVFNGRSYGQDHLFDVHGGVDRRDGTDIAGDRFMIHHNTFMPEYTAVNLRGEPREQAVIERNWFHAPGPLVMEQERRSPDGRAPVVVTSAPAKTAVRGNAYGRSPNVRVGLD